MDLINLPPMNFEIPKEMLEKIIPTKQLAGLEMSVYYDWTNHFMNANYELSHADQIYIVSRVSEFVASRGGPRRTIYMAYQPNTPWGTRRVTIQWS